MTYGRARAGALFLGILSLVAITLFACLPGAPTRASEPAQLADATPSPTVEPSPAPAPTPETPGPLPTALPTPTETPAETSMPSMTSTPSVIPTDTATPTETPTATPEAPTPTETPAPAPSPAAITPEPGLKVAFIGDTANGRAYAAVLNLIKAEGAAMVLHQGDFDYDNDADGFEATINSILGPDFPYFLSVGNHDILSWNAGCLDPDGCYAQFLKDRLGRLGITPDDPDLNDQMYSISYRGLRMVFVGQEGPVAGDATYAPYIQQQLADDNHLWRICSWHKNQAAMQVGGKGNEMGWKVYETCKDLGAIIATAHEHSYQRTRTLVGVQTQTVDPEWPDPDRLRVAPGASFVFVSGLGGHSTRSQLRCLPGTFPYGCQQEWARIYTGHQGATFGALFITFGVDGDPHRARGYFKNIRGEIVDQFEVVATR